MPETNKDVVDDENNDLPVLTDEEIENLDLKSEKVKKLIKQYEEETRKYAIWHNTITEGFKKWLRGEKVYDRDKERIALYLQGEMKKEWQDFIKAKPNEISSLSDLIRVAVNKYIWESKNLIGELAKSQPNNISKISHDFKEPLTSIKGYSQFILENYEDKLEEDILTRIQNIFDQSLLLEQRIRSTLDDIRTESSQYDILLIEDDLLTNRLLTDYFDSKGCSCQGVETGSEGLKELNRITPKVILLDIMLPDVNGDDICRWIKSDKKKKKIPVYFITAKSGPEVEEILKDTNSDGYILKPFNLADLEVILDIINGFKPERQGS